MKLNDLLALKEINELIKEGFSIIYLLTNTINFKKYIGFTSSSIIARINSHISRGKNGYNLFIGNAIVKYGEDNFDIKVIYLDKNKIYTKKIMEPLFIKFYNSYYLNNCGYNMTHGGEGTFGYKRTEEERKRISEMNKGRKASKETLEKMSKATSGKNNPRFGKYCSEETKEKIRSKLIGKKRRPWTEEEKLKNSIAHTGKKFTEETRMKMSKAQKGKKGRPHTEEHKEYMSKLMKGRIIKESTRKILSDLFSFIYIIKKPDGEVIKIKGLNKFCDENNISYTSLGRSLENKRPCKRGKNAGWQLLEKIE